MHAGTVVEFDHPHILLSNPDGYFTSMVDQTGKSTADSLKKIAEQVKNSYPYCSFCGQNIIFHFLSVIYAEQLTQHLPWLQQMMKMITQIFKDIEKFALIFIYLIFNNYIL